MQYPGDIRKLQRISLLILLFCIAGMAAGADAATPVRGAVTTTSPFSNPTALTTATVPPVCQAPCECLSTADAQARWGAGGYTQCSQTPCYQYSTEVGSIKFYCYQQKKVTTAAIRNIPPVTTTLVPVIKNVPAITTTTPAQYIVPDAAKEDKDHDGLTTFLDNCPNKYNPNQADSDGDGVGDACDNCWYEDNIDQIDSDNDCAQILKNDDFWGFDPQFNEDNNPLYATCGPSLCLGSDNAKRWLRDPKCGDACDNCPDLDNSKDSDNDGISDCDDMIIIPSNLCNGELVDFSTDAKNCGECGKQCKVNNICKDGSCTCKDGWGVCNVSEGCHNLQNDWQNCGKCGNICKAPSTCLNGVCTCEKGLSSCTGMGACTDLKTDPDNCGLCGHKCTSPEACINGHCQFEPACGTLNPATDSIESCHDGIQNQDETGVDCGGKCPPCNTKCTTGTKYAPPDTPCTSVYNYQSTTPYVTSSNYPADTHYVDAKVGGCDFCNYPCRNIEVCHPALDPFIEEALKCCSKRSFADIKADLTLEYPVCEYAAKYGAGNCQKCTGIYISRKLATSTEWMWGHFQGNTAWNPTHCWDLNHDGVIVNETECQDGDKHSPPYNLVVGAGGTPPYDTANYLLNFYKTGTCGDYATAVVTLLRKAGYSLEDVGATCDGQHCYAFVRFPGDTKWQVVDADATQDHGRVWEYGVYQGTPQANINVYPYCEVNDENSLFFGGYGYNSTAIPDVDAYWDTVKNGKTYTFPHAEPFLPICEGVGSPRPCSVYYANVKPMWGPGFAGVGKDNPQMPVKSIKKSEILGCGP